MITRSVFLCFFVQNSGITYSGVADSTILLLDSVEEEEGTDEGLFVPFLVRGSGPAESLEDSTIEVEGKEFYLSLIHI